MSIVPTGNGSPQLPPNRISVSTGNLGQLSENNNSQNTASFDILGALLRRKFVILLLAILGALFGWLHHAKQPDVFSSWLKLMVWTNSAPLTIDGDRVRKSVSLNKQQNLISSEMVLGQAVKNGNLNVGVSDLKKMLTISSIAKSDDTLVLTCDGPNAEKLPNILNAIVTAYKAVLKSNSRNEKESAEDLIEKLRVEIDHSKNVAEKRYLELISKVGEVGPATESGDFTNPHALQLMQLKTELNKSRRSYKDILSRINTIHSSLYSNDTNRKKILALEARKFLGLSDVVDSDNDRNRQIASSIQVSGTQRIYALEQRIAELEIEENRLSRIFGPAHRSLEHARAQIKFWRDKLASVQLEQKQHAEELPSEVAVADSDLRKREEQRWITLYSVALDRERERLAANVSSIEEDLKITEQEAAKITQEVAEINVLKRQIDEKSRAVRAIIDQLTEIKVLKESDKTDSIRVEKIDEPKTGRKIGPVFAKNIGYGTFLGLLFGTVLALMIDKMDMSFRTPSEIIDELGVPVIGKIPKIGALSQVAKGQGTPTLVTAHKAGSSASEAFRAARTAVFFASQNNRYSTFLVTSPSPGDGKSTVASNLAISMAQTGKSVVLIDADFRRPRIHQYFDHPIEPGSVNVLNGELELDEAIIPTFQPNLSVLSAGGRPKSPGELVTSVEFRELIDELRSRFDYVLIDSPPLLPVADSTVMASMVDGVYMVMRIRKGVRVSATSAKDKLDQVNANVLGVIVNGMDQNPHYSEYGYYYYTYGSEYGRYYDTPSKIESEKVPPQNGSSQIGRSLQDSQKRKTPRRPLT